MPRWPDQPGRGSSAWLGLERTYAWQNASNRLLRCYERSEIVMDAFLDLADTIITLRSLIRQARTTHRWNNRPQRRPCFSGTRRTRRTLRLWPRPG